MPPAPLKLSIDITSTATWQKAMPTLASHTKKVLRGTLQYLNWPPAIKTEVSIVFTTDGKIQTLNRDWRGKDKPTNVLSFPQLERFDAQQVTPVHLGDVVLAFQTMKREALAAEKPLKAHVAHLLVHGMLHLLGYDHETSVADARKMERTEIKILHSLGYENPYLNYDH